MTPRLNGADLHLHTIFSDGAYTPETLIAAAREKELAAIAVTDHDSLYGVAQVRQVAQGSGRLLAHSNSSWHIFTSF